MDTLMGGAQLIEVEAAAAVLVVTPIPMQGKTLEQIMEGDIRCHTCGHFAHLVLALALAPTETQELEVAPQLCVKIIVRWGIPDGHLTKVDFSVALIVLRSLVIRFCRHGNEDVLLGLRRSPV